jgi:hypothetical protein
MKTFNIYISLNVSLKYVIILIVLFLLYFIYQTFQLYTVLRLSELCLAVSLPSNVTNITNTSLSVTTLIPSSVLQTTLPLYIYFSNKSVYIHNFPISHEKRRFIPMNFSHCDRKYGWPILPKEQFYDDFSRVKPNSFCWYFLV